MLRNLTDHVCASEGVRYALNTLCIEQHAVVSTDGCRLIYAPHRCDPDDTLLPLTKLLLVPVEAVNRLVEAVPNARAEAPVTIEDAGNGEVWLTCAGVTIRDEADKGKFPNWRAILPNDPPKAAVTLSADYAAAVLERAQGGHYGSITMRVWGKDDAIAFSHKGWAALVMPIDGDDREADPFESARRLPELEVAAEEPNPEAPTPSPQT